MALADRTPDFARNSRTRRNGLLGRVDRGRNDIGRVLRRALRRRLRRFALGRHQRRRPRRERPNPLHPVRSRSRVAARRAASPRPHARGGARFAGSRLDERWRQRLGAAVVGDCGRRGCRRKRRCERGGQRSLDGFDRPGNALVVVAARNDGGRGHRSRGRRHRQSKALHRIRPGGLVDSGKLLPRGLGDSRRSVRLLERSGIGGRPGIP